MPMCRNLLAAGFHLTAHNRSQGKVEELALSGAHPASSPAEVAQVSDIILTCLPDIDAVEAVYFADQGILSATRAGQVLVDHSTVGPSTSRRVASAAEQVGALFLDAPISGGSERAADATLTIMAGGNPDAYHLVLPIFQAMGQYVYHVGPTGAGTVAKLVNQLLVGIHCLAAAEAMVLGVKGGADPRQTLEILLASWGQSFILSRNGPAMIDRDFSGHRAQVATILKDLRLIREFAQDVGSPTPAGDLATRFFEDATNQGLAEDDPASIVRLLEELAGIQVSGSSG